MKVWKMRVRLERPHSSARRTCVGKSDRYLRGAGLCAKRESNRKQVVCCELLRVEAG